jgi:ubiquinone biosynthesis monooxygenase Coq7
MQVRELSPLDRLIGGVDTALRTVLAPARHSPRPNPAVGIDEAELGDRERSHAAGLMRVNHAGEIAAQGLYQGHAVVARDAEIKAQMHEAAVEEFDHLAWCEQRLTELGESPSRLSPVWYAGAFTIGAASGLMGDKWSLGFIAETERQVVLHLESHLEGLPADDLRSRTILSQMRDEEDGHGKAAVEAGAAELPGAVKRMMKLTARVMTTAAYRV